MSQMCSLHPASIVLLDQLTSYWIMNQGFWLVVRRQRRETRARLTPILTIHRAAGLKVSPQRSTPEIKGQNNVAPLNIYTVSGYRDILQSFLK